MSADYVRQIRCMFYLKNAPHDQKLARLLDTASKFALFFGVRFERRKVDKKQTYTKTEICKPYSRVFWMFLPNVVKIDPYNFEVYRFKVCAFFSETQCSLYSNSMFHFQSIALHALWSTLGIIMSVCLSVRPSVTRCELWRSGSV